MATTKITSSSHCASSITSLLIFNSLELDDKKSPALTARTALFTWARTNARNFNTPRIECDDVNKNLLIQVINGLDLSNDSVVVGLVGLSMRSNETEPVVSVLDSSECPDRGIVPLDLDRINSAMEVLSRLEDHGYEAFDSTRPFLECVGEFLNTLDRTVPSCNDFKVLKKFNCKLWANDFEEENSENANASPYIGITEAKIITAKKSASIRDTTFLRSFIDVNLGLKIGLGFIFIDGMHRLVCFSLAIRGIVSHLPSSFIKKSKELFRQENHRTILADIHVLTDLEDSTRDALKQASFCIQKEKDTAQKLDILDALHNLTQSFANRKIKFLSMVVLNNDVEKLKGWQASILQLMSDSTRVPVFGPMFKDFLSPKFVEHIPKLLDKDPDKKKAKNPLYEKQESSTPFPMIGSKKHARISNHFDTKEWTEKTKLCLQKCLLAERSGTLSNFTNADAAVYLCLYLYFYDVEMKTLMSRFFEHKWKQKTTHAPTDPEDAKSALIMLLAAFGELMYWAKKRFKSKTNRSTPELPENCKIVKLVAKECLNWLMSYGSMDPVVPPNAISLIEKLKNTKIENEYQQLKKGDDDELKKCLEWPLAVCHVYQSLPKESPGYAFQMLGLVRFIQDVHVNEKEISFDIDAGVPTLLQLSRVEELQENDNDWLPGVFQEKVDILNLAQIHDSSSSDGSSDSEEKDSINEEDKKEAVKQRKRKIKQVLKTSKLPVKKKRKIRSSSKKAKTDENANNEDDNANVISEEDHDSQENENEIAEEEQNSQENEKEKAAAVEEAATAEEKE